MFRSQFVDAGSTEFYKFYSFEKCDSSASVTVCNLLDIFLLDPENGAKVELPSSAHCINDRFQFSPKLLKLVVKFGDSGSNNSRDIRAAHFVMDGERRRRTHVVT